MILTPITRACSRSSSCCDFLLGDDVAGMLCAFLLGDDGKGLSSLTGLVAISLCLTGLVAISLCLVALCLFLGNGLTNENANENGELKLNDFSASRHSGVNTEQAVAMCVSKRVPMWRPWSLQQFTVSSLLGTFFSSLPLVTFKINWNQSIWCMNEKRWSQILHISRNETTSFRVIPNKHTL